MTRFRVIAAAALLFLNGCASSTINQIKNDPLPTGKDLLAKAEEQMKDSPSIVKIPVPRESFIIDAPPPFVSDKPVSVSFDAVNLQKLVSVVAKITDLNIIIKSSSQGPTVQAPADKGKLGIAPPSVVQPAAKTAAAKTGAQLYTIHYKGDTAGLFNTLSEITGMFFIYRNGVVTVSEEETFSFLAPNYPDLLSTINESMGKLGAKEASYDLLSSTITFKGDYNAYRKVSQFLRGVKDNLALVTMRIMVMNVKLDGDKNMGIDWGAFAVGINSKKSSVGSSSSSDSDSDSNSNSNSTDTDNGTDTGSSSSTSDTVSNLTNGAAIAFNSSGASLFMETSKMAFKLLLNFMERNGRFSVMQNVFLETMSGKKGKIEVITETPYISGVGTASLSGNSSGSTATSQSAKATSGVTMDIAPHYNKRQGMVSIDMKVKVEGINRLITLSSGNLGSLTQPETTKKSVDTFLVMRPDQIAIIGGLVYESNSGDTSGLPYDSLLTKRVSLAKQKEELVIVVKPTIYEFVPEQ